MRNPSPLIATALALAVAALAGCPKNVPGAGSVPSVPGGGAVPGGLGGVSVRSIRTPAANYAAMDGGAKLKAFLQATKDLQTTSEETIKVVKQSCEMIGREMGMGDADFQGDTKAVCEKVYKTLRDNMKVAFKAQAGLKIKYKPAVCRINIDAEAKAAAECEGHASADVGASCTGACHGRCDGTCSGKAGTGGNSAQCDGECKGTCHGECEGHAKVNASAQCRAQRVGQGQRRGQVHRARAHGRGQRQGRARQIEGRDGDPGAQERPAQGAVDPGPPRAAQGRGRDLGPERPGAQGDGPQVS